MSVDLKPCPFCGEIPTRHFNKAVGLFFLCCNVCGADGPLSDDEATAIEKWNERKGASDE